MSCRYHRYGWAIRCYRQQFSSIIDQAELAMVNTLALMLCRHGNLVDKRIPAELSLFLGDFDTMSHEHARLRNYAMLEFQPTDLTMYLAGAPYGGPCADVYPRIGVEHTPSEHYGNYGPYGSTADHFLQRKQGSHTVSSRVLHNSSSTRNGRSTRNSMVLVLLSLRESVQY